MRQYCIRSSVTIFHGPGVDRAKAHSHSIEIAAYVERETDDFEQFRAMEQKIEGYLGGYRSQYLNVMPEFNGDTSLENIGEVFFAGLSAALKDVDLTLVRLEVGETPLRVYAIGVEDVSGRERETRETEIVLPGAGGI